MSSSEQFSPPPVPRRAHWGVWATVFWGLGIFAVFAAAQTIAILAIILRDAGAVSHEEILQRVQGAEKNGTLISVATLVSAVLGCGAVAVAIAAKNGATIREYLNLKPVSLRTVLLWIGGMLAVLILSDLLTAALQRSVVPEFVSAVYKTSNPVWLIWAATVIGAPLFEETFFRGFLFKSFEASAMGPAGAILLTSFLWAGIHLQYDLYGIGLIFILGLIIGAARTMTGSLYVPLAMHSVTNILATAEAAAWG